MRPEDNIPILIFAIIIAAIATTVAYMTGIQ